MPLLGTFSVLESFALIAHAKVNNVYKPEMICMFLYKHNKLAIDQKLQVSDFQMNQLQII